MSLQLRWIARLKFTETIPFFKLTLETPDLGYFSLKTRKSPIRRKKGYGKRDLCLKVLFIKLVSFVDALWSLSFVVETIAVVGSRDSLNFDVIVFDVCDGLSSST